MGSHADDKGASGREYVLQLFVTGHTEKSVRAVRNVTRLCEQHLRGQYDLKVVDLYQQPELAAEHQLVAAPTLIKTLPLPARKLIGDMSDSRHVLAGLGLAG